MMTPQTRYTAAKVEKTAHFAASLPHRDATLPCSLTVRADAVSDSVQVVRGFSPKSAALVLEPPRGRSRSPRPLVDYAALEQFRMEAEAIAAKMERVKAAQACAKAASAKR